MLKVAESAAAVVCWSCSATHDESALFCPNCNKIQPPPAGDYFSVFGIKLRLNLDLGMLMREFHKLSRKLHPDRFARASANEKEWSLANTALLNDAYRTLRDPIRRTEYLLKLCGAEIGEEYAGKGRTDSSRVPPDLLEEVFDLNMQIEEMRANQKMGDDDPILKQDLANAKVKFDGLLGEVDNGLRAEWKAWDDGDAPGREAAQKKMVSLLDRRRYLNNLVREVTETLQGDDSVLRQFPAE